MPMGVDTLNAIMQQYDRHPWSIEFGVTWWAGQESVRSGPRYVFINAIWRNPDRPGFGWFHRYRVPTQIMELDPGPIGDWVENVVAQIRGDFAEFVRTGRQGKL